MSDSNSNSNNNLHKTTVKKIKGKKVMTVKNFMAGPVTIELTPIQQHQLQQGKPVTVKVVPVTKNSKGFFSKHQQKHKGGTRKLKKSKKQTRKNRK